MISGVVKDKLRAAARDVAAQKIAYAQHCGKLAAEVYDERGAANYFEDDELEELIEQCEAKWNPNRNRAK